MELYCATSDVKSTGGDKQAPPSVDLTTNALPEVQKPATATNLQTGVSTNNVLSKTSVDTNKDTKDTPHWYALRTTYGREKKAYDYLLSKNVVAFWRRGNSPWIAPALLTKYLSTTEHEERQITDSMHLCPQPLYL